MANTQKKRKVKAPYKSNPIIGRAFEKIIPIIKSSSLEESKDAIIKSIELLIDESTVKSSDRADIMEDLSNIKTNIKLQEFVFNTILECSGMGEI